MKISLKVIPGSKREGIVGWLGDSLKIRVRAPAESGKANAAVISVLASALGLPGAAIKIVSGKTAARKIIEIEGLKETDLRETLIGNP